MARDTLLTVRLVDARSRIAARVEEGQGLLAIPLHSEADLRELSEKSSIWDRVNVQLLQKLFSDDSEAAEYDQDVPVSIGMYETLQHVIQRSQAYIEGRNLRLRTLLERLEFFDLASPVKEEPPEGRQPLEQSVFIVHGHAGREDGVARVVEKMGIKAVILAEAPHAGSPTLIEKLEREAASCGYAVVIYTGDDVGMAVGAAAFAPRARENVVLELGYFIGRLGRSRVTVLHDPDVPFPTDFQGVGYHPLDPAGAWKAKLVREIEVAYPTAERVGGA